MRSTDHVAPRYAVSSIPPLPVPPRSKCKKSLRSAKVGLLRASVLYLTDDDDDDDDGNNNNGIFCPSRFTLLAK